MWAVARQVCNDRVLAEDVSQTVFTDLWRRPGRFDPARGRLRRGSWPRPTRSPSTPSGPETARQRRQDREGQLARSPSTTWRPRPRRRLGDDVRRAVEQLSADEREAIVLSYFGGHSYRGRPGLGREGTVKTRIRRGLMGLRRALEDQGDAVTVAPYRHHPLDDLAAYALGAVDDLGERQAIEHHLAGCEPCRRLLADDEATLAWLVTDEDPPASVVWAAIDVRTGGDVPCVVVPVEFGSVRAAPPAAPEAPRGLRRRRLAALVAVAASLLAAVAAGPSLLGAGRDGGPAPGTRWPRRPSVSSPGADGAEVARVRAGRDGPAVELTGVALLPQGRTYQHGRSTTATGRRRSACWATAPTRPWPSPARRHPAGGHQRQTGRRVARPSGLVAGAGAFARPGPSRTAIRIGGRPGYRAMAPTTTTPASPSPPPTVELRHSTGGGGAASAALAGRRRRARPRGG